jgi:hypothetical protein
MDKTAFVRGLQPATGLENDIDGTIDREPLARVPDEVVERGALQKRHDQIRLNRAVFFEFSDIVDLDDVGVAH